jgi:hypothetical protein
VRAVNDLAAERRLPDARRAAHQQRRRPATRHRPQLPRGVGESTSRPTNTRSPRRTPAVQRSYNARVSALGWAPSSRTAVGVGSRSQLRVTKEALDVSSQRGGGKQLDAARAQHDRVLVAQRSPGVVGQPSQVGRTGLGAKVRPELLYDLIAHKPAGVGKGKQRHQLPRPPRRPIALSGNPAPDRDPEAPEHLDANVAHVRVYDYSSSRNGRDGQRRPPRRGPHARPRAGASKTVVPPGQAVITPPSSWRPGRPVQPPGDPMRASRQPPAGVTSSALT